MHDDNDEVMDRLLRNAMAADAPQLSPAFDARVMQSVRPRRLPPLGRVVMVVYAIAATALTVWLMQGLPIAWIAVGLGVSGLVAAGVSAYGRRLAYGG